MALAPGDASSIPTQSSLNPFYWYPQAASRGIEVLRDEPRDFAYGHVPLYLGVAATRLVERLGGVADALPPEWLLTTDIFNGSSAIEFRHLTAVSRALTGLIDAASVLLVFLHWSPDIRRRCGPACRGLSGPERHAHSARPLFYRRSVPDLLRPCGALFHGARCLSGRRTPR